MSRVKELADVSKEVIQKLDEAKRIHEQKYIPLWNEIYNHETTTKQEQEQLRELEEIIRQS